MTIDRNLYIVTEQVEQQAEHTINSSVVYVGYSPSEARMTIDGGDPFSNHLVHRVNHNHMGAKDAKVIQISELLALPEPISKLDS